MSDKKTDKPETEVIGKKKELKDGKTIETEITQKKSEPEAEAPPPAAVVPEQIVKRRGTTVGGQRTLTKSEYDKEIAKERGPSKKKSKKGSDEESE